MLSQGWPMGLSSVLSKYVPQREDKISTSYQRYILTIRTDLCMHYILCMYRRGQNKEYLLYTSIY